MSWHIAEERHDHPHELLGDVILGLNDGITTTLVFALSVAGASNKYSTVVLAGLAEMFAGGVAMFLGGFMSAQSKNEARLVLERRTDGAGRSHGDYSRIDYRPAAAWTRLKSKIGITETLT